MHDNTLHYFEQQRQLLLDGLEAFRRRHPHQAQLLGISGQTITDPQLRALLDGVAYLTGLTAQQLALTAPQLTETLVRTAFPDYLRPVPALLPVLFTPQTTAQMQVLAAETPFTTHTAAGETIHWRTQHPLTLMPLAITTQQFIPQAAGYTEQEESRTAACSLQLTFSVTVPGVSLSELNLMSLTLHFTGDGDLPWLTDDAVHRQCAAIRLNAGEADIFLPPDACQRLPLTYRPDAEDDAHMLLYDALWYPEQVAGAVISLADPLRHCNGQTFTLTFFFRDMLPHPAAAQLWGGNTRLRVLSRAASAFFACRTEFQYAPPVRMPYHPPAGTGNRLGGGAVPGTHCYLRAAHLRVQVSADPLQPRDHWQPGGEYHHYLGQFIRTFFRRPLTFSVIFRTDDTRMMPVQLAAMTSRLGRNTRL